MAIQDYLKAQKLADKQYRQADADDAYPLLPNLEDILRKNDVDGQIPIGQFEIPISMIKGTAQSERTSSFASNYMPLLDPDTEFACKWSLLCDSVREVGVNEPIVVYEYRQRFYVVEGNKRVSVSKYFGAVSIEAIVTRIVPKLTDSPDDQIYAEFMDFHRITGIYEIRMKQPGGFLRLLQCISPVEQPDDASQPPKLPDVWSEDLRKDVKFMYSVFSPYYKTKINTQNRHIRTGDAFLHFIEIYGFEQLRGLSSAELHRRIDRIRQEFRVLGNPTSHILQPTAGSRKIAFTKKLSLPIPGVAAQILHIGFLFPKDPECSGWSYNHEIGRRYLEDTFRNQITTSSYICTADQAEETISRAIADGCKLIFTTSPVYHAVSMRMAVAHPETIIVNCSMNTTYKQLRTYYLRIYEAKFITGVIAGSMTENERIGYIADYPVIGTPASIGAFALGVKLVNPRAMVYLDWSTLENHDPADYFRAKQIDLISDRDINAPVSCAGGFGLYGLYGDVSFPLAAPVWNWGSLYESLVRSVLIGAWKNDSNDDETHALNYYWGMSSGAIDVACSSRLPSGTQKLVHLIRERITEGEFEPFTGTIYGQDGLCKVEERQSLTPAEIIAADWLPDNVIGEIPEVSELAPQFREFAKGHPIRKN